MKKNIEQQYFAKQKARRVLNIIFGTVAAIGIVLFISPLGPAIYWLWLSLIGIFGLIFTNSGRVTDKDFDSYMKEKLNDELAVEQPDYSAEEYDITAAHYKIGKDKQIRTDVLCQTLIYRTKSTLRVVSKKAVTTAENCETYELEAPLSEICIRIEEKLEPRTNKVHHTMTVDSSNGQSVTFPVTSDYATEQFAEEINARSDFAKSQMGR